MVRGTSNLFAIQSVKQASGQRYIHPSIHPTVLPRQLTSSPSSRQAARDQVNSSVRSTAIDRMLLSRMDLPLYSWPWSITDDGVVKDDDGGSAYTKMIDRRAESSCGWGKMMIEWTGNTVGRFQTHSASDSERPKRDRRAHTLKP